MLDFLEKILSEKGKDETSKVTPEELEEIISEFERIINESDMRYKPDDIPRALRCWMKTLK